MPTYEYQCSGCEHEFELYQSFSASPITICPQCGAEKVSKKISGGAGVVFKGGGFYETDYKRGKGSEYQTKSAKDGGAAPSTNKTSSDSKTTSSPAPKSNSTEPKVAAAPSKSASKSS